MIALEFLYAATVFLSAFLLFQIQPMIAKMILPWFGGSSAVWSTCMLFFQLVLLFGYVYPHWLQDRFVPRRQALIHTALLAASLLALPIAANPSWKPSPGDNPSLKILALLVVTVGLPYFVVSTTSSMIQAWYARTHRGAVPYRLFALSNFASLLGLLTYPVLVEPALTTHLQANIWSVAYGCFVILCITTSWIGTGAKPAESGANAASDESVPELPATGRRFLWVTLAACASVLLLSVTTYLTQDVAPIPLLWVLPLAVYLLSFVLCFNAPKLYNRSIFIPLVAVALIAIATRIHPSGWTAHLIATISVLTVCLFICCMFCHGELARLRPHPRYLTGYYVMISLGGAIGGLFVGLIAPNFFNAYYEFPIGLALCAALVVIMTPKPGARWLSTRIWKAALSVLCLAYAVYLGMAAREGIHDYLVVKRNFYGQLRVNQDGTPADEDSYRDLLHGRINHGEQMLNEKYRRMPVSYF